MRTANVETSITPDANIHYHTPERYQWQELPRKDDNSSQEPQPHAPPFRDELGSPVHAALAMTCQLLLGVEPGPLRVIAGIVALFLGPGLSRKVKVAGWKPSPGSPTATATATATGEGKCWAAASGKPTAPEVAAAPREAAAVPHHTEQDLGVDAAHAAHAAHAAAHTTHSPLKHVRHVNQVIAVVVMGSFPAVAVSTELVASRLASWERGNLLRVTEGLVGF